MKKNYTNPSMSLLKYAEADVINTLSNVTADILAGKNDDGSVIATKTVTVKMTDILKLN